MNTRRSTQLALRVTALLSRRSILRQALVGVPLLAPAATTAAARQKPGKAKKQLFCLKGETVTTRSKKQVKKLRQRGAARGACPPAPPRCIGNSCTVFTTVGTFNGAAVNGVAGGDAACQAEANAVGLPGVYRAWLSAGLSTPLTRFSNTGNAGPYRLVENASDNGGPGPQVAANFAALISCLAGGNCLTHGIDRDVIGTQQPPTDRAWTGTVADGTVDDDTCDGWTSTGSVGGRGLFGNTDAAWTESVDNSCTEALSLYCFEQAV